MKILLSYDGMEPSQKSLEFAIEHADAFQAQLDIVTIVVRKSMDQKEEIEEAEKLLEKAIKVCQGKNIQCKTKLIIKPNHAGEALLEYAKGKGYKHIIIGIRRTSKVGKMLMGSNAQYVILNADCPVLTVGKNL